MREHLILVDNHKCIGCSICVNDCPKANIEIVDKKAVIKSDECIKCAHCVAVCPKFAVSMTGFDDEPITFNSKPTLNPDELLSAIQSRRSIRQFKDKPVPEDIIKQIIEAGRWTPTAQNSQAVSYIVLRDKRDEAEAVAVSLFRKLMPILKIFFPVAKESPSLGDSFFFKGAPLVILVVSKDKVSASLASSNMALMAESHNLGVLFSGFFAKASNISSSLRKVLGISRKDKVVTTLVIGYPSVKYFRTAQKESAKISWL